MTSSDSASARLEAAAPSSRTTVSKEKMNSAAFLEIAQQLVVENFNEHRNLGRSPEELTVDGVNLVWFVQAVISWKAQFTSPRAKKLIWEVTYNRVRHEMYVEVYSKMKNIRISMDEEDKQS